MHLPQQGPSERGRQTGEQTAALSNHRLKAIQLSWWGCCLHRRVDYEKPHPRCKDWWAGFPFPLWRIVFSIFLRVCVCQAQISDPEMKLRWIWLCRSNFGESVAAGTQKKKSSNMKCLRVLWRRQRQLPDSGTAISVKSQETGCVCVCVCFTP